MEQFQFDINELNSYLNQQQEEKIKEQKIAEALEEVKRSYTDTNFKYSSSVENYLRLKVEYHKAILDDLAKEYPMLDPEKWESKFVTADWYRDCKQYIDLLLHYKHPGFPRDNENTPYVTVQFKVISCYANWSQYRPKMSYDLKYHTNRNRHPLEAYALRNIDYYVWFYWSKAYDTWRKIYILKDPKVLTPDIMLLSNNNNPDFGTLKEEKPEELYTKRTLQLNPDNELFRKNLIWES